MAEMLFAVRFGKGLIFELEQSFPSALIPLAAIRIKFRKIVRLRLSPESR